MSMGTGTGLVEQTEIDPVTGKGRVAHIVRQSSDKTAQALVTEAMVMGMEVEALCGHRWVPSRNPKAYPMCQACEDVYYGKVPRDEGLPES